MLGEGEKGWGIGGWRNERDRTIIVSLNGQVVMSDQRSDDSKTQTSIFSVMYI